MSSAGPPPELHLPDLPDVAVHLGGGLAEPEAGIARPRAPWPLRLQQALSAYLPLLLMALLAAGTWWLVKNTPQAPKDGPKAPVRQTPDYTMNEFSITRFDAAGRVVLRIDGDLLRHFPDNDRLEIDGVRIHAIGLDGRITDATARHAVAKGDASEVRLEGGARVLSQQPGEPVLDVRSEFLHAFVQFQRLSSHLPVQVLHGQNDIRAGGLDYDHAQNVLKLQGKVRMTWRQNQAIAPGP